MIFLSGLPVSRSDGILNIDGAVDTMGGRGVQGVRFIIMGILNTELSEGYQRWKEWSFG